MNGVKRGAQAATNDAKSGATEQDAFVSSDAPTPAPRVAACRFDDARLSAARRYEAGRLPLLALPAGSEAGGGRLGMAQADVEYSDIGSQCPDR